MHTTPRASHNDCGTQHCHDGELLLASGDVEGLSATTTHLQLRHFSLVLPSFTAHDVLNASGRVHVPRLQLLSSGIRLQHRGRGQGRNTEYFSEQGQQRASSLLFSARATVCVDVRAPADAVGLRWLDVTPRLSPLRLLRSLEHATGTRQSVGASAFKLQPESAAVATCINRTDPQTTTKGRLVQ
jgi:hypothetical protein